MFQQAQAERVNIRIGSNTTVIGLRGAEITGADVQADQETNVILRGLTATDAYDRFPAWDPTDGDTGNWNSEYDTLSRIQGLPPPPRLAPGVMDG